MIIKYLFSHPEGDIILSPLDEKRRFKISPIEDHPFLTLGDYFMAIEEFILGKSVIIDHLLIDRLNIRSEKHGALSHVAKAELITDKGSFKFAVITALSGKGWENLTKEFNVISRLNNNRHITSLPRTYSIEDSEWRKGDLSETFTMALLEWFEDYHEWHISEDKTEGNQKVYFWDQKRGYRYLSEMEVMELFRQASKILGRYYDLPSGSRIDPWHHAAGDFVVKAVNNRVDVRLTTARDYSPIIDFEKDSQTGSIIALLYYLLELTIKMRIDKEEGTGNVIWIKPDILPFVLTGFFEGLGETESEGPDKKYDFQEIISIIKSFSKEELERLFHSLLEDFIRLAPEDLHVAKGNMTKHVDQVHRLLQKYRE